MNMTISDFRNKKKLNNDHLQSPSKLQGIIILKREKKQ